MYGLRIGLGGAGSSNRDGPSLVAKPSAILGSPTTAASLPCASTSLPASSLVSRLAASSSAASPFQSDDASLSHLIPMPLPARPLPLSIADTAAEAKRQERKQRKAERKKKAGEDHPSQLQSQQTEQQQQPVHQAAPQSAAPTPAEAASTSRGPEGEETKELCSAADEGQSTPAAQTDASKKKKKKEHKRALRDDDVVSLRVSDLRSLLTSYSEAQLKAACRALLASPLTPSLPSLSAKQRKELMDRIVAEHNSDQTAQHSLHNSQIVRQAIQPPTAPPTTAPSDS